MKKIAFYLPQFHPDPVNNKFWGDDFTDWTTTSASKPLYAGHNQPRIPHDDIGYYSLDDPAVIKKQASIAKKFGVDGFAIYSYWFGKNEFALRKPVDLILENKDIEIEFFLSWVNTDWTMSWVGRNDKILYKQKYFEDDYKDYFSYLKRAMSDSRYLRVNNKPIFYVHHPLDFDFLNFKILAENFLGPLCWICPKRSVNDSLIDEFDYVVGFPPGDHMPYKVNFLSIIFELVFRAIPTRFKETSIIFKFFKTFSYGRYVQSYIKYLKNECKSIKYIPTVLPNWDNSPRYNYRAFSLTQDSSGSFSSLVKEARFLAERAQLPFFLVKAWNEWAEGNVLEPSSDQGYQTLEEFRKGINDE